MPETMSEIIEGMGESPAQMVARLRAKAAAAAPGIAAAKAKAAADKAAKAAGVGAVGAPPGGIPTWAKALGVAAAAGIAYKLLKRKR